MTFKKFYESGRPHPYFGQMKNWAANKRPQANNLRMELQFDSRDGKFEVHYGETDSGQFFIWTRVAGSDKNQEYKQFTSMKKALGYLNKRFGISLKGYQNITDLRRANLPKHAWK